jgi:hypothetical protein
MALNEPVVVPPLTPESDEQWETRARFRDDLVDALRDELAKVGHDVVGGEDDGVFVVTRKQWQDAINAVAWSPIPPVDHHYAEVLTDAIVTVWAVCPRCGIAGSIALALQPELRVDHSGAELRLKAKAKPRTHVCGQLTLPAVPPEVEGQESLDLEEMVGPRCRKVIDVEADTVCILPEGHAGECSPEDPAEDVVEQVGDPDLEEGISQDQPNDEADDDLLPGELRCEGSNHVPNCEHFDQPPAQA